MGLTIFAFHQLQDTFDSNDHKMATSVPQTSPRHTPSPSPIMLRIGEPLAHLSLFQEKLLHGTRVLSNVHKTDPRMSFE